MKKRIDVANWARREHFEHFRRYEEPYHGVVFEVDMTATYEAAKARGQSVFLHYLYRTVRAAQAVEAFRLRLEGEAVYCYERLHAGSTLARRDHTFGFGFIPYHEEVDVFVANGLQEMARIEATTGLAMDEHTPRLDVIHCSPLPWLPFTGLTHARPFHRPDSVPKISFGKLQKRQGHVWLPVAVNVHHALVDGYHVGLFYEALQREMGVG